MNAPFACSVMSEAQADALWRSALRILAEIGVVVENRDLLDRLAAFGASADFAGERARFPSALVERFVADSTAEYEETDGAAMSCLFPSASRKRLGLEVTAGTYPQYLLTPEGAIVPHTLASAAAMTRLGDALGNIDRLGAMGIPSDVPPGLAPLHMRLTAWKHARRKPSGCGEVRDPALIPHILEMGRIAAEARGWTPRECSFAEVEMISPLRFARVEARIFEEFRAAGLLGVLQPPEVLPGRSHIFHQYVIRAEQRDELQAFLREGGIGSEVYYPVPLHEQECFRGLGYGADDFPCSRAASRSTLALPVYPELSAQQRRCVVDRIARFYRGAA